MKTDRELLELAAKAAGFPVHIWGNEDRLNCARIDIDLDTKWNPLTDDGDAIRLAVGLELNLNLGMCGTLVYMNRGIESVEEYSDNYMAAFRRAITRAAAAIGERMP